MKKSIFNIVTALFVLGSIISFCYPVNSRLMYADKIFRHINVDACISKLDLINEKVVTDIPFQHLENETKMEIMSNEALIVEMKSEINGNEIQFGLNLERQIKMLERKNRTLKETIELNKYD